MARRSNHGSIFYYLNKFFQPRATWLWGILIVFGLLDGFLLIKLIPDAWFYFLQVRASLFYDLPLFFLPINIGYLLLTFSLVATCLGYIAAKRWAFIVYYTQIPLRAAYASFTFFFLDSLAGPILDSFPDRGFITVSSMLISVVAVLEIGRLILTIMAHRRIQKYGRLAIEGDKGSKKVSRKIITTWVTTVSIFLLAISSIVYLFLSGRIYSSPHTALRNYNYHAMLKILKKKPKLINSVDKDGYSILQILASSPGHEGRADIVESLLEMGADINMPTSMFYYPLHHSANRPKMLEIFLSAGADPNVKTSRGRTPLHKAVYYSQMKSIELLLKYGAKINAYDENGDTPLHQALSGFSSFHEPTLEDYQRKENIARILISNGADPHVRNKADVSPLDQAKQYFKNYERKQMVEILKRDGH